MRKHNFENPNQGVLWGKPAQPKTPRQMSVQDRLVADGKGVLLDDETSRWKRLRASFTPGRAKKREVVERRWDGGEVEYVRISDGKDVTESYTTQGGDIEHQEAGGDDSVKQDKVPPETPPESPPGAPPEDNGDNEKKDPEDEEGIPIEEYEPGMRVGRHVDVPIEYFKGLEEKAKDLGITKEEYARVVNYGANVIKYGRGRFEDGLTQARMAMGMASWMPEARNKSDQEFTYWNNRIERRLRWGVKRALEYMDKLDGDDQQTSLF